MTSRGRWDRTLAWWWGRCFRLATLECIPGKKGGRSGLIIQIGGLCPQAFRNKCRNRCLLTPYVLPSYADSSCTISYVLHFVGGYPIIEPVFDTTRTRFRACTCMSCRSGIFPVQKTDKFCCSFRPNSFPLLIAE